MKRALYWKRPPRWKKRHVVTDNIYAMALCGIGTQAGWPDFSPHDKAAPKCKTCERKAKGLEVFE